LHVAGSLNITEVDASDPDEDVLPVDIVPLPHPSPAITPARRHAAPNPAHAHPRFARNNCLEINLLAMMDRPVRPYRAAKPATSSPHCLPGI
jgi:hypothetical protein